MSHSRIHHEIGRPGEEGSASLGRWKHAEAPDGEAAVSELVEGHKAVVALPTASENIWSQNMQSP